MPALDRTRSDSRRTMTERGQRYVPRSIRRTTRGFSLVLALLVTIYVIAEVWDESDFVQGLVWLLAFLSFIVTLRALNTAPRTVYINAAVMALMLVLAVVGLALEQEALTEPAGIVVSGFAFVAPVLILRHVLRRDEITVDVIFGALAVYVYLGIDFAILYDIMQRVDSGAFAAAATELPSMFYFSFTTLTTVGYGDITPVSDWAQALTVVEALTGQILLVVIVARLVGMQIAQHHRPASGRDQTHDQ